MASSTCHVFGGTKRVRLERIVRPRYVNGVLDVAVFQTRLQDLWIVHGVCHMGTTTADVFSLTLYLTARSKRVHVRKHKRLCARSEEHTSELQSLMRISYPFFCLKQKKKNKKYV